MKIIRRERKKSTNVIDVALLLSNNVALLREEARKAQNNEGISVKLGWRREKPRLRRESDLDTRLEERSGRRLNAVSQGGT